MSRIELTRAGAGVAGFATVGGAVALPAESVAELDLLGAFASSGLVAGGLTAMGFAAAALLAAAALDGGDFLAAGFAMLTAFTGVAFLGFLLSLVFILVGFATALFVGIFQLQARWAGCGTRDYTGGFSPVQSDKLPNFLALSFKTLVGRYLAPAGR
jgi:hypothetical protein